MSIRAADLELAAAVSPRIDVVAATGSTNADLLRHVAEDPAAWPHLSVVVTDDQRAGRGRLDRTWTAPAGTALAVSVLVRAEALPPTARGWLPLIAGAAMTRAVAAQLEGAPVAALLKWPNDVLLVDRDDPGAAGRKLCGILAEVVPADPDAIVVGAGVNTAMPADALPVPTAVSFAAIGRTADADRLLADYLADLDRQVRELAAAGGDAVAAGIHEAIESLCATVGRAVTVKLPSGDSLVGVARRLDHDGRLVVADAAGVETAVGAGDVLHVR